MDELGALLAEANEIGWAALTDYPTDSAAYRPAAVTPSLRGMFATETEAQAEASYNSVLFAVGNNHRGSLYQAAGPAAGLVSRSLSLLQGWAQFAAIEVLHDVWLFSLSPVGPADDLNGPAVQQLQGQVSEAVAAALPVIEEVAASAAELRLQKAAASFLADYRDQPPG